MNNSIVRTGSFALAAFAVVLAYAILPMSASAQDVYDGYWGSGDVYDGYWGGGSSYDGYWGSGDVYDGYWGSGDIYDGYFGSGDIYDGYFGNGDIYDGYFGSGSIYDGYFGNGDIYDGYFGTGSITDGYFGTGSITDGYTGAGTITDGYMGGCTSSCYTYSQSCDCYQENQPMTYSYSESSSAPMITHNAPMTITPPRFTPPVTVPPTVQPPRYTPPVQQPPRYMPPIYQPQQPNITNVNTNTNTNTNINTCTGNSCNTNLSYVDNSINGSFNTNYAPVYPITPAPTIQYQFQNQGLFCIITASPTFVQPGQSTILSWSSYGATSATLSDGIGQVQTTGTFQVRPFSTRTYVLTIYGQGGSANCSVLISTANQAPTVSLSQIPYTGLDLGPIGNAIYWMSLLAFAAAGAYLMIYYKGGALALATETVRAFRPVRASVIENVEAPISAPALEVEEMIEEKSEVNAFDFLPVAASVSTTDTMSIAKTADGTPRIVINRS